MKARQDAPESRDSSVARVCAFLGMLALVAFVLMTIADVLMRWLFNNPINGVADTGPLIVAIVAAAFFPYSLVGRHHVSIGFLGSFLGARAMVWLEAFASLVTWIFLVLLAWQIVRYTVELRQLGQTTWVVQIPIAPWWMVVSFFVVVCAVVQLGIVVAAFSRAKNWHDGGEAGHAR
ncbi:MAG: TRAP transporter small permease [Betaproteobacteria bacterium]|nr:TRAP transporter small permease [Betaproteobacteria bacterium]